MLIADTLISSDTDAYVIAEIGHNHQGKIETCKEMFDAAKWAGANAVKLQKRDNKFLYTEEMYHSPYNSENAFGPTYGSHREALEFNEEQYLELKEYADELGIHFFATAFDIPSADFLRVLDLPAIKIASGDICNTELLLHVAGTWDKPVIISTGGATYAQVIDAVNLLDKKDGNLAVLQCTSGYPADYSELDLKVIEGYLKWFPGLTIGYSGHDTGIIPAFIAYTLGARIIEKHFTLNRAWKGTDQAFSLEPKALKQMVDDLKLTRLALGSKYKRRHATEFEALKKQLKNKDGKIDGQTVPA